MILYQTFRKMRTITKVEVSKFIKKILDSKIYENLFHSLAQLVFIGDCAHKQRQHTLQVIVGVSICLLLIMYSTLSYNIITDVDYDAMNPIFIGLAIGVMCLLFIANRKGYIELASYAITFIFVSITSYTGIVWGLSLPFTLLGFILCIIVITSVHKNNSVVPLSLTVVLIMIALGINEANGNVDISWKNESVSVADLVVYIGIIFFTGAISWVSSKQILTSLKRALRSESDLKDERDQLEETLERRTKELRISEYERISNIEDMASLGKIASGIFHDIISPISAISLYVNEIENKPSVKESDIGIIVDDASRACERLKKFIKSIETNFCTKNNSEIFDIRDAINNSIDILSYKAREKRVLVSNDVEIGQEVMCNRTIFTHIITNLISNAIDAYEKNFNVVENVDGNKLVRVYLKEDILSISDDGVGIKEDDIKKIFEPFYTTKTDRGGHGIGLTSANEMAIKYIKSEINVKSTINKGSIFYINISDVKHRKIQDDSLGKSYI